MNKALFIISLQHELAMAIGNELDLKTMLKVFLKVCFNRLNLTSAHIYTYTNDLGLSIKITTQQSAPYQHLISLPKTKHGELWTKNEVLMLFTEELNNRQRPHEFQHENKQYFFGFIIPQHGLLVFETQFVIEAPIQKALIPILEKLATSCYTSIVHDSLVQEVYSRQVAEERIAFQAQHDGLTGLLNRQAFECFVV
ncbi:GGDEF domain-containing protein [Colwellia sp. MSW7]|uniref:GGDEF domain-containing protein n=1 Tax=Colwellia maritima TaxID=2912588 RepID=A0ABS9X5S0_9GAMM|nr:GGDEF domain-containing protein [Colwellia maritima]MCI2285588.1 GGDEF domain-containing protein [Colwellia maritima]